MSTHEPAPP